MNYRHIYHAGNFADVFKHAVLARLIEYLKRKEAAFRVIDTHAGIGLYDLSSPEAAKTGEWIEGAGRLIAADLPEPAAALLEPFLSVVPQSMSMAAGSPPIPDRPCSPANSSGGRTGSRCANLHPADHETLAQQFKGDFQVRVMHLDGWLVPGAHLPPKEKRGLVLIDPPFEQPDEFARLVDALGKGRGALARRHVRAVVSAQERRGRWRIRRPTLEGSGIGRLMRAELWVRGAGRRRAFAAAASSSATRRSRWQANLNPCCRRFHPCWRKAPARAGAWKR